MAKKIADDETIDIPGVGGRKPRKLQRQLLGEILEPRVEEMFTMVNREILRNNLEKHIGAGVVLTGGASLLEGMTDMAEAIFKQPARLGKPLGIQGLTDVVNSPLYATGVGLVLYGAGREAKTRFRIRDRNIFERLINTMKKWFRDII